MSVVRVPVTSLVELHDALINIRNHMILRQIEGWEEFQSDEVWEYNTERDPFVCPICAGHEDMLQSGTEVGEKWNKPEWTQRYRLLYPNTHANDGHPYSPGDGRCRCELVWVNYPMVLAERLAAEFRGVVVG